MAASFYESLEEKSSRLFFCCWVMGDGYWMLGVDEVLVGQKAYRADKANRSYYPNR